VTDWFFPKGIDHHHLMAGVPGISDVMQTFARQMAGVGRLPDQAQAPVEAARIEVDVIVIGGGLAGISAAAELAERGLSVCLVEERAALGGIARAASKALARAVDKASTKLEGVHVLTKQTAVGVFDGEVLVASDDRATLVRPKAIVLATGAHDGQLLTEGNDVPGVVSERAALVLASHGVLPKGPTVVVGETRLTPALLEALGDRVVAKLAVDEVGSIEGRSRVTAIKPKKGKKIPADVVVVAVDPAPAFELGAQAGASVERSASGYAISVDEHGHAATPLRARGAGVFAIGECTGAELDATAIASASQRLAAGVSRLVGQPSSIESKSPKPPATKTTSKRPSSMK
jgi:sarcosine oxidase subunit alpha